MSEDFLRIGDDSFNKLEENFKRFSFECMLFGGVVFDSVGVILLSLEAAT